MFTPQDPRTYPSRFLQPAIVGTAKVGDPLSYYTPIPVGAIIRNKLDVGDHPGIVGKSLVDGPDTIRRHPVIFRHRPGVGQEQMTYYQGTNPQTQSQQDWRAVFAAAVLAWQNLTDLQRYAWRTTATRRSKMGYSMFLTEYLHDHKL